MIRYYSGKILGVSFIPKIYDQILEDAGGKEYQILDSFILPKEFELLDRDSGVVKNYEYWFLVEIKD